MMRGLRKGDIPSLSLFLHSLNSIETLIDITERFVYQVLEKSRVQDGEIDESQVYEALKSLESVTLLEYSSRIYLEDMYLRKQLMKVPSINDSFWENKQSP